MEQKNVTTQVIVKGTTKGAKTLTAERRQCSFL